MSQVFLALVLTTAQVNADTVAPVLKHPPVSKAAANQNLRIRVEITDDSEIFAPAINFRPRGNQEYVSVALRKVGPNLYEASLPPPTMGVALEYFVEAFDEHGNGPARIGSPEQPLLIEISDVALAPPPPGSQNKAVVEPPVSDKANDDGSVFETWWFWTLVGAAVAGGVTATAVALSNDNPRTDVSVDIVGPSPTVGL